MSFAPGDRVRLAATERTGVVISFQGQPLEVLMDDEAERAGTALVSAIDLLNRHTRLFWQARLGNFAGCMFVGAGHRLYSVSDTLKAVERELRQRGCGQVYTGEAAAVDLLNIVVQESDWRKEIRL